MLKKLSMTALSILAMSALAFAGEAQVAKGRVTALSGNTISVSDADGQVWAYEVTASTRVVAEGAAHKAAKLSSVGKKTTLDEFVRENQRVTVSYSERDGTRFVEKLRVH
jgi:YD repeat-containing protein